MLEYFETLHWASVFQIILIDLLLGGDNAVVIALACRRLPPVQRLRGIIWGTAGALLIRLLLIGFALTLLGIPYLKIVGGVLLLWIGVRLLLPEHEVHVTGVSAQPSVLAAVKTILAADIIMSLDNVVAIAAAAQLADPQHQFGLVVFGLLVSVPIIVWGSTVILKLIDRFPLIVTFGAGLLGWIAGGMLMTDHALVNAVGPVTPLWKLAVEATTALLVIAIGRWLAHRKRSRKPVGPA